MDLNRIVVFLRVVESGGFTRAAKALNLPTSSVSRSVSQLEEELGVRLLQRTTRTLRLTEAGEAYAARAQEGLKILGAAEHDVRAFGSQLGGRVRITAASDMSSYLADFAQEIAQSYPGVELDFVLTPRRLDLLAEGIDIGIRAGDPIEDNLVAKRVGVAHFFLYCARGRFGEDGLPNTIDALSKVPFVVFRGATRLTLRSMTGEANVDLQPAVTADDMTFCWHALVRGLGVGLLPAFVGDQGVADGLLERVLPEYWCETSPVFVVMLGGRFLRPNVLAVRDALVNSLKQRDWWGPRGVDEPRSARLDLTAAAPRTISAST